MYIDQRLTGVTTWDGLKGALGLRAPTIEKLQQIDPHTPAARDADGKRIPAGHEEWNQHGITTSDAQAFWVAAQTNQDEANDGTGNNDDAPVDRKTAKK